MSVSLPSLSRVARMRTERGGGGDDTRLSLYCRSECLSQFLDSDRHFLEALSLDAHAGKCRLPSWIAFLMNTWTGKGESNEMHSV